MSQSQDPTAIIQRLQAEVEHWQGLVRQKDQQIAQLGHFDNTTLHGQLSQASSPADLDGSQIQNEFQLANTAFATISTGQDGLARRNTVPRTSANSGFKETASAHLVERNHGQAVKRQRTSSQQSHASHAMARNGSNMSTASAGPFAASGPITPPQLHSTHLQTENSGMLDYMSKDEPVNSYAYGHSMRHSLSKHKHDMPPLIESNVLYDPKDFFAAFGAESSVMPPSSSQDLSPNTPSFNHANVSTCGSMTTAPTIETVPITRQNSSFNNDNQSVSGPFDMLRLNSCGSQGMESVSMGRQFSRGSFDNSPLGKRPAASEEDLFAVGSSLSPPFPHQYATSAPLDGLLASHDMERSVSNTSMASNKSTASLKLRAKQSLSRHNLNAKAAPQLKPKPLTDYSSSDSQSATNKKDGKAAIAKTKYERPKHPKVFCELCEEYPDGFRGEHELRRHKEAKHQTRVKKWICVDPVLYGLHSGVAIVNALTKCKACNSQKKYGAYYNAAAHLRRTHFKAKPSRSKNKNAAANHGNEDDKRGGKGGGDWPPMSELKNWMKEIWVSKHDLRDDDEGDTEIVDPASANREMDLAEINSGSWDYVAQNMPESMTTDMDFIAPPIMMNADHGQLLSNMPPLSSANFDFPGSPPNQMFPGDMGAFAAAEQMPQYSSAVSSVATVTPATALHEPTQLDELDFNMMYSYSQ